MTNSIVETTRIVPAIAPIAGGSARSGDWVSFKGYKRCTIAVHIAMGNAATTTITFDKAKTVAGGSNVDGITMPRAYKHTGALGAAIAYVLQAAATSFTSSNTGSGQDLYLFDIEADELGDDYDCLQVELGASNAANIVAAWYILSGPRYAGAVDTGFPIDPTVD